MVFLQIKTLMTFFNLYHLVLALIYLFINSLKLDFIPMNHRNQVPLELLEGNSRSKNKIITNNKISLKAKVILERIKLKNYK